MKIIEKTITLENKNKPINIIPIGDIHIGSANCDKKYLKELIDWVKNEPNTYVVGMGDYIDAIIPTDKRFDIKDLDVEFQNDIANLPMKQIEYVKKIFEPIKNQIITLLPGNHEEKFRQHNYVDVLYELCKDLNVERGDYMTFIRIKFDRTQFHIPPVTIWAHHGFFGGGRKKGGKVNNLEDIASGYLADIYITGHSHDLFATSTLQMSIATSGKQVYTKKKIFVNTGTFLNTITTQSEGYSERKAYTPKKIGVIKIEITPKSHNIADIHIRE